MIKAGNYMMAQMPIRMMEMEHAEHGEHLDVLKSLTNNMTPPADAYAIHGVRFTAASKNLQMI
ncbi:MAG: hypothetical protein ACLR5N_03350 [Haemophilus parainfluenzae]